MSNVLSYGFEYLRPLVGHPVEQPVRWPVATAYATNLNKGDPVYVASGYAALCPAATTSVQGVIVGIEPYWDGVKMVYGDYLPSTTPAYGTNYERESRVLVQPAAHSMYRVCSYDSTYATYATYLAIIGQNADHNFTDASGTKNWPMLTTASVITTTAQWRICALPRDVYVDYASKYVPLVVSGNEVGTPPASPAASVAVVA
jgi:hypothetical protein